MSISAGFTSAEIVEFVHEYHRQSRGQKGRWLADRGISHDRLRRWQSAVFDGDLDRGLIPREGGVTTSPGKRISMARQRDAQIAGNEAELARLRARVGELEATNDALGKAIGLLHARNVHEPDAAPPTSGPEDSSTSRTDSSPS